MKTAVVLLTVLVLAAACSSEKSATVEKTTTAVPTATAIATQTIATPVATICPTANLEEEAVREVLKKGEYHGETVGLSLTNCQIHGYFDFKKINQNPNVDVINPMSEVRQWEINNNLPVGTLDGIYIDWDLRVAPSSAVCTILADQGLKCKD